MKLLTIIGTRPEAVKMAPVLRTLARRDEVTSLLALTGQHPDLAMGPLRFFGLTPDYELGSNAGDVDPLSYVARTIPPIAALLDKVRPDRVIVQGDTASAMAAAQAAASRDIPIAHVEAGLRTHASLPWPEEPFRIAIDALADLLFAPTPVAAANLRSDAFPGVIHVTGNSGVDALQAVLRALDANSELVGRCDAALEVPAGRRVIVATLHRRENIGRGAAELCAALQAIDASGTADVLFPLHPNPELRGPIRAALRGCSRVRVLEPLCLVSMVRLMQHADLILTDSGGIQEEAPSLGKPALVLRDVTERPEGVAAGIARLTGARCEAILAGVDAALAHPRVGHAANPYGDGRAAKRIVAALLGEPYTPFGNEPRPIVPVPIAS
jgi:UDP-N-acetylglucosamine 2-epimerase (non-hydrolysing)